jgi:hypothetical protein
MAHGVRRNKPVRPYVAVEGHERLRAALFGDPAAFVEYRTKIMGARGLLSEQQTTPLRPTSFSPLK